MKKKSQMTGSISLKKINKADKKKAGRTGESHVINQMRFRIIGDLFSS